MAAEGEPGDLCSELEILRSIYLHELLISHDSTRKHPWELSITLHPATANATESQYVCLTLDLSLPAQYPDASPEISIRNPRGLSDDQIQSIWQVLEEEAETGVGAEVLYQLIEKAKEILTDNNVPYGQCVICLNHFQESDSFTRTICYHYFHSYCLARYIQHLQTEPAGHSLIPRPSKHAQTQAEPYEPDEMSVRKWQELQRIYRRQMERGGIIDPEGERDRFLVSLVRPADVGSRYEGRRTETLEPPSPREHPEPRTCPSRASGARGSRQCQRRGRPGPRGPFQSRGPTPQQDSEGGELPDPSRLPKAHPQWERLEGQQSRGRGPWPRRGGRGIRREGAEARLQPRGRSEWTRVGVRCYAAGIRTGSWGEPVTDPACPDRVPGRPHDGSSPGHSETSDESGPCRSVPGLGKTADRSGPYRSHPGLAETADRSSPRRSVPGLGKTGDRSSPCRSGPGHVETSERSGACRSRTSLVETGDRSGPCQSSPGHGETNDKSGPCQSGLGLGETW